MERRLNRQSVVTENNPQVSIIPVGKTNVPDTKVDPEIEKMHRTGRIPRSAQYFKTDAF